MCRLHYDIAVLHWQFAQFAVCSWPAHLMLYTQLTSKMFVLTVGGQLSPAADTPAGAAGQPGTAAEAE